ncbi:MAG: hypothetical protein JO069_20110 [Verrucomicrobia bacterium]|nr:hypothetical protein [Verrucomicrobiota bacterium]
MKKFLLALTCAATLLPSVTTPASAYSYYYRYRVWRCGNHIYWRYHYWYRY